MPDNSMFGNTIGLQGGGGTYTDLINSMRGSTPGTVDGVEKGAVVVDAVMPEAIKPITPEDITKFYIEQAKLSSKYSFAPDQKQIEEWGRQARQDPTGESAQLIRKSLDLLKKGEDAQAKAIADNYISDINEKTGVRGVLASAGMPELVRAATGLYGGVLDLIGTPSSLTRDPLVSGTVAVGKAAKYTQYTLNPMSATRDLSRKIMGLAHTVTTGKPAPKANASDDPIGTSVDAIVQRIAERRDKEIIDAGGDSDAVTAARAYRSFGKSDPITNALDIANRASDQVAKEASYGYIYADDRPDSEKTTSDKIKTAAKSAIADTPFNIFKMMPLVAAGAATGATSARLTKGMMSFDLASPFTEKVVTVDMAGLTSRLIAGIPEAAGEANRAAQDAKEKAIIANMNPELAGANAWSETFAGNVALLSATNSFGDGKLMLETFKKSAPEVAKVVEAGLAKAGLKKFGAQIYRSAKLMAKEMGGDFFGEGIEEYGQKIISDMASNPKANTWNDFKKSALSEEALAEFLGGAFSGVIVGEGGRRAKTITYGKDAVEAKDSVLVVHDNAEKAAEAREKAKGRSGEELYNAYVQAQEEARTVFSQPITAASLTPEIRKEAGITREEQKVLSLALSKLNNPLILGTPEEAQILASVKPIMDRAQAAQLVIGSRFAQEMFNSTLLETEAEALKEYSRKLNESKNVAVTPVETAPAAVVPTMTAEELALLPAAQKELEEKHAAIEDVITNNKKAIMAEVKTRLEAAEEARLAELKKNNAKDDGPGRIAATTANLKPILLKIEGLVASGVSRETATKSIKDGGLLSTQEAAIYKDHMDSMAIFQEIADGMRARAREEASSTIGEKHAPGSAALLHALRNQQKSVAPVATTSGPATAQDALNPSDISTRKILNDPMILGNRRVQQADAKSIKDKIKKLLMGNRFKGISKTGILMAQKHGATSPRMARALRLMLSVANEVGGERARVVETMVNNMGLTAQEKARVNGAYTDTIHANSVSHMSLISASRHILAQISQERLNGLSSLAIEFNTTASIVAHERLAGIVKFASDLGVSMLSALEAIVAAEDEAAKQRIGIQKTGNAVADEFNEKLRKSSAGRTLEIEDSKKFIAIVRNIIQELAGIQNASLEEAPGAFDTTTSAGVVQAEAYAYAIRHIMDQIREWRSFIGRKGQKLSDADKRWDAPNNKYREIKNWRGRVGIMAMLNELLAKSHADPTDKAKGTKKGSQPKAWKINEDDYSIITQVLLDQGIIREDGTSYAIVGMGNARETALGIIPALAADAYKIFHDKPGLIKIPTMEELTAGMTGPQVAILKMYFGIEAFAQNYLSDSQIGSLLRGMAEETVATLRKHVTNVVAGRFPNLALLAESYSSEISRLLGPQDMYESWEERSFRLNRLEELQESMTLISKLPGAFNAYTHHGTETNKDTSTEPVLLNKGFFPSLRDLLIDMGAPDAILKERDEARIAYFKIAPEYHKKASKNPRYRTIEEKWEIERLQPAYRAARDRHLTAIGRVYQTISPETRKMLDFVAETTKNRVYYVDPDTGEKTLTKVRGGSGTPSGNRVESALINRIAQIEKATTVESRNLAYTITTVISEVLEGHGYSPESIRMEMQDIGHAIMAAYANEPNNPIRAGYIAAILALEESPIANEIGMNSDGHWIIQNNVVDRLRVELNTMSKDKGGRSIGDFRREQSSALKYKKMAATVMDRQIETARKTRNKIIRALRVLSNKAQANIEVIKNQKNAIYALSNEVTSALFLLRMIQGTNKELVPGARINSRVLRIGLKTLQLHQGESITQGIPGYMEILTNLENVLRTGSIESSDAVVKLGDGVLQGLRKALQIQRDILYGDGFDKVAYQVTDETVTQITAKMSASSDAKTLQSAITYVESMLSAIRTANSSTKEQAGQIISGKASLLIGKGGKITKEMESKIREIERLQGSVESLSKETTVDRKVQTMLDNANIKLSNLKTQRINLETEMNRLTQSVLPLSEESLRDILDETLNDGNENRTEIDIQEQQEHGMAVAEGDTEYNEDGEDGEGTGGTSHYGDNLNRTTLQQMKESGIALDLVDTVAIANQLVSGIKKKLKSGVISINDKVYDTLVEVSSTLLDIADRLGIQPDDSANMILGFTAISELASSEFASLLSPKVDADGNALKFKRSELPALVDQIAAALDKLSPERAGLINRAYATYAVENLTGRSLSNKDQDSGVISALLDQRDSNLAKEAEAQRQKAEVEAYAENEVRDAAAKAQEEKRVARAKEIERIQAEVKVDNEHLTYPAIAANALKGAIRVGQALASVKMSLEKALGTKNDTVVLDVVRAIEAVLKEDAKLTAKEKKEIEKRYNEKLAAQKRAKKKKVAIPVEEPTTRRLTEREVEDIRAELDKALGITPAPSKVPAFFGIPMVVGIPGMTEFSPEGLAFGIAIGTAYLGYHLAMRNASFAEMMNKIRATSKNTVSEIATKIKMAAKGISDRIARIMAALWKDTLGIGGGKPTNISGPREMSTLNRVSNEQVQEDGPVGLVLSEPTSEAEVEQTYRDQQSSIEAASKPNGGVVFLNAGLNMDTYGKMAADVLAHAVTSARSKAVKQKFLAAVVDPAVDGKKYITQWVHRILEDSKTRIMDIVSNKLHSAYAIIGGYQPILLKIKSLKGSDLAGYTKLGEAVLDSSVQSRIIKADELASRYGLSESNQAIYSEIVKMVQGTRNIVLAAFNKSTAIKVANLREEQNRLKFSSADYDERYSAIEETINELEDEAESIKHIIKKNPVFVSLLRNSEGTRKVQLVDTDNNVIGMTFVDTGSKTEELTDQQKQDVVNSMLKQHAKKMWAETGFLGSVEAIERKLQNDYASGKIKYGFLFEGKLVENKSQEIVDDDHFNFVKMAGGMMTTETLTELLKNRGDGVTAEARRAMLRDLQYMAGARAIEGRLRYARDNVAGYSEDILGALSLHAHAAGHMVANLEWGDSLREELNGYHREMVVNGKPGESGETKYKEMLNYVLGSQAPSSKATRSVKTLNLVRSYSAWLTLGAKASFGVTQGLQGMTTSQLHMMAHYDNGYHNMLYYGSFNAARKMLSLMMGLGADLSMADPVKFEAMLDKSITYEMFPGVWENREEASRMIPVVKAVMREVIKGPTFKDVNVGMQLGVEDAADRQVGTGKMQNFKDNVKDSVGYVANKMENLNRIRDILSYTIACATEQRAGTEAGNMKGEWAKFGYVSITDDSYNRLTYSDLRNEVASAIKSKYKGHVITAAQMKEEVDHETVLRIMSFAERQSAHSNFNTGRGFGSEMLWNPKGNTFGTAISRTIGLFRLYPINIMNAWRVDMSITERRLKAQGTKPSMVMLKKYKSTAIGMLAAMLLGGAFGFPMAGVFANLLSAVYNWLGKLWGKPQTTDMKRWFVEGVRDLFTRRVGHKTGHYMARFVAAGIFGLTPFYGMGAQLSAGEGPINWESKKNWRENSANLIFGANTGIVDSSLRGKRRIESGDYVGGFSKILLPGGVSRIVDAAQGSLTPGRRMVPGTEEFYKASPTERLAMAFGTTPYKAAMIYDQDDKNFTLRDARKEIINDIQKAFDRGEMTQENYRELQQWNDLMIDMERPELRVKARRSSLKARQKREIQGEMRVNEAMGED